VGLGGLEPPTSPLSGVRSNHLSYRPSVASVAGPLPSAGLPARLVRRPSDSFRFHKAAFGLRPAHGFFRFSAKTMGVGARAAPAPSSKEVIQPQVPLGLPCYDFTPVMDHSVASAPLAVRLPASGATHSHGVTGGVYKARERIHRGILIRDY
jgi:hypothetical protein